MNEKSVDPNPNIPIAKAARSTLFAMMYRSLIILFYRKMMCSCELADTFVIVNVQHTL